MTVNKLDKSDWAVLIIIILMMIYAWAVGAPKPYIHSGLGLLAVLIIVRKK
jgi:1,4-dihydroxy-2-naphthoate octaprenyltransferase